MREATGALAILRTKAHSFAASQPFHDKYNHFADTTFKSTLMIVNRLQIG